MTDWKPTNVSPQDDRNVVVWMQAGTYRTWRETSWMQHAKRWMGLSDIENVSVIAWADVTEPTVEQLNPDYIENEIKKN